MKNERSKEPVNFKEIETAHSVKPLKYRIVQWTATRILNFAVFSITLLTNIVKTDSKIRMKKRRRTHNPIKPENILDSDLIG